MLDQPKLKSEILEERCVPTTNVLTSSYTTSSANVSSDTSTTITVPQYTLALAPSGVPTTFAGLFAPQPSSDGYQAFLKGLYNGVLFRAPDTAGYNSWLTQLENGSVSRYYVTQAFINSTENRTNQVQGWFEQYLDRNADPTGLAFYVNQLQTGFSESQVLSEIILSSEFTSANDTNAFVNTLYQTILGRAADAAGLAYWTSALNNGTVSRATVLNDFITSPEGLQAVINSEYSSYLERTPKFWETNQAAWALANGYYTYGQFQASILTSREFFSDAIANEQA
ncbi:DUF4214 domain-containing protein [Telmatocola sphagniphila]|uniref:DUF4214 domain-containing protein n=1 Tax=Telmatocola sphagniphila TaxID=1123043 RepID=A0A8E6B8X2_9BACT|nr:DUF4214 domain-containing protein [Telmatocola sphagniphila]QVL33599.1 DUF4214 domain-containing protein [Telmatocola sphagniphila]